MKPDFLIIGAQKSGTTSLYEYLIQHPQISPASQKEIHFFDLNYHQGIDWYLSQFPDSKNLTGESSPYYLFHPLVPQRVHQYYPNIKLIILLRNPINRTWSHYHHEKRLGFETLTFEQALAGEKERLENENKKILQDGTYYSFNHQHYSYLSRGLYLQQIKNWQQYFDEKNMLILKSEDFYNNPQITLNQTYQFLQIPPHTIKNYPKHNSGEYPPISPAIQDYLNNYFSLPNQQLNQTFNRYFW